jgi:phage regulator Rha-like protein
MNALSALPAADLTMSSVEIAELTGKQHGHVLRDLREPEKQGVIDLSKFGAIEKDSQKRDRTLYRLPKRETLILTSGYSAVQRAAIINRWLALEGEAGPLTETEVLHRITGRMVALEAAQQRQTGRIQRIEDRLGNLDGDSGYATVLAYGRRKGLDLPLSQAKALGRLAAKRAKALGIAVGRVPDERWGYPVALLDELLAEEAA